MAIEAGEVIVEGDAPAADDMVITLDPIEFVPIAIAEPLPADDLGDVPPDAQTFGGPVDAPVDVPADAPADGGSAGDPLAVEDLMFTTTIVDSAPVDEIPLEDGVPADGSDDGSGVITVGISGDVPDDGTVYTMDDSGTLTERPSDPEPNWRTLGGAEGGAEGGSGDTGSDPVPDVVLDKDPAAGGEAPADDGSETPDDVIYTLDPSDPLIYANTASGETPGRSADPLPFERTNSAPAADLTAPDTTSDVVHYAAAEPFHTGLDLL